MTIGGKLIGLVGASSLVTLVVAGVGLDTLRTFNASVGAARNATENALFAAELTRLTTDTAASTPPPARRPRGPTPAASSAISRRSMRC